MCNQFHGAYLINKTINKIWYVRTSVTRPPSGKLTSNPKNCVAEGKWTSRSVADKIKRQNLDICPEQPTITKWASRVPQRYDENRPAFSKNRICSPFIAWLYSMACFYSQVCQKHNVGCFVAQNVITNIPFTDIAPVCANSHRKIELKWNEVVAVWPRHRELCKLTRPDRRGLNCRQCAQFATIAEPNYKFILSWEDLLTVSRRRVQ